MQVSDCYYTRLINYVNKTVNGNVTEVASKEDLVFALHNNLLNVGELVTA